MQQDVHVTGWPQPHADDIRLVEGNLKARSFGVIPPHALILSEDAAHQASVDHRSATGSRTVMPRRGARQVG